MVNVSALFKALIGGSRLALARSITLVESSNMKMRPAVSELMNLVYMHNQKNISSRNTLRIGISGAPGAGKSTFINALASHLLSHDNNLRLSVLTVDPSSPQTGGSLLADSLRMDMLCHYPEPDRIFIRSTPSCGFLGGVHRRTPYAIQLSEACGYDITLVETVGTGQSEVTVSEMVDCFCVLISPAGGDEIQAIKKGIIELADVIAITKNDVMFADACKRTYRDYLSAVKLFPPKPNHWKTCVTRVSSKHGDGIDTVWDIICRFRDVTKENHFFYENRCKQFEKLFHTEIERQLIEEVFNNDELCSLSDELQYKVATGKLWPASAAHKFVSSALTKTYYP